MVLRSLSEEELSFLDEEAGRIGFSEDALMERAGLELCSELENDINPGSRVLIIAGPGNNGGDGIVLARHLFNKKFLVDVVLLRRKIKETPARNLEIIKNMGLNIVFLDDETNHDSLPRMIASCDVIVDAILGFGQSGEPRDNVKRIISLINNSDKKVFSVDIPTGIGTDGFIANDFVIADKTISLAAPKKAFESLKEECGRIIIRGIGIPAVVYEKLGLLEGEFIVDGRVDF